MKKSLAFAVAVLLSVTAFSQTILIADNNAGAPAGSHVYSTLQEAIDASSPGDIIHVIPSPNNYGTVTIGAANDSISLYGIGFKPDKDGPALSTVSNITIEGSGIKISGFTITSQVTIGNFSTTVNNLSIENCNIDVISSAGTTSFNGSNIIIRNCYISLANNTGASLSLSDRISNSVITNCIIGGYQSTSNYGSLTAYNGTVVKNNIFWGDGEANKHAFDNLQNSTVTNNIFFGRPPSANNSLLNVTFNNNIAAGSADNTLPPQTTNGVTGTGNFTAITDATSIFADAAIVVGDNWDMNWEPTLSGTTSGLVGTDGTAIGPVGSTLPWNPTGVGLPIIQSVITNEVIKQGDDLDVTIKARGN